MKILLTGFDPFGGERINPSWEAIKNANINIIGVDIFKLELPTEFIRSSLELKKMIKEIQPDAVLLFGQAGGRNNITIEKVAINYRNSLSSDNANFTPKNEAISSNGADGYFSTLPIELLLQRLKEANIPSSVSYSAGTFVCNSLFYSLMELINNSGSEIKGGFIHVPYISEQVIDKNLPSMSLDMLSSTVEVLVKTMVEDYRNNIEKN